MQQVKYSCSEKRIEIKIENIIVFNSKIQEIFVLSNSRLKHQMTYGMEETVRNSHNGIHSKIDKEILKKILRTKLLHRNLFERFKEEK